MSLPIQQSTRFRRLLLTASVMLSISACSLLPGGKVNVDTIAGQLKADQASQYGFQKQEHSAEQKILVQRFELDKSNLDHAIANTRDVISKSYGRPFLPELHIRLAELYAEKSRIVFFLRRLEMGERGKMREISSVEAAGLKEKAIETYLHIIGHYPNFEELDKVYFYLAHEFRELGKLDKMSAQYKTILEKYPTSSYVPEALLLLGDQAFSEKNIDEAHNYYRRVLHYPTSSAAVVARYKLAWVHINKRNYKRALALFEESVTNKQLPSKVEVDTYNRVDIRLEALSDMAFTYSQVHKNTKPGEDSAYFKKIAWSRQSYVLVMEKLARRLMIKRKWDNAAYIYRELAEIQYDSKKLLDYTDNLYTCIAESKNYANSSKDVALIIKALEHTRYSVHMNEKQKNDLLTKYELYARDVATRLHENAKRSKNREDFQLAAEVYEDFLNFFDDSPEFAKIQLNYAEALFSAGKHTKAGRIYEAIAQTHDNPKTKHDPLYSAAVSYYTALDNPTELNYYDMAYAQDGLRDTGQIYASLYPKSPNTQDIQFNIARIRYDKGEFKEAVEEFNAFIKKYPKSKNTKAAVGLMMDALNIAEDYFALIDLQQAIASNPEIGAEIKQDIAQVGKAAQSKIIQEMVVNSINDWDTGKEQLLSFADTTKTAGLDVQALNALFISSEEHGDIETMHVAGQSIVNRFPSTPHADTALKSLIDLSLTTAQYRVLADYLEQYVKQFPKSSDAADFLFQAAQIRASLKQNSLAIELYQRLLRNYKLDQTTQNTAAVALVNTYNDNGEKTSAFKAVNDHRRALGLSGYNALAAESAYYTNRTANAQKHLNQSAKLKSRGDMPDRYIEALGRTAYALANRSFEPYMNLRMGKSIDNSILEQKTAMLEKMQKAYTKAINFKSPRWTILSCFRVYEINNEFAQFLEQSPMPDGLSKDDIQQYQQIIREKANEYRNEGLQYLQTGQDLAKRIKPFDHEIASTLAGNAERKLISRSFNRRQKQKQLGLDKLQDKTFRQLYDDLFKSPNNSNTLLTLANLYINNGDHGQALAIAQGLVGRDGIGSKKRAQAYALMGSVYMHNGEDAKAREALQQALEINNANYSAAVNLAGLYHHYGYKDYANGLYGKRVGLKGESDNSLVHARAEGFFNGIR